MQIAGKALKSTENALINPWVGLFFLALMFFSVATLYQLDLPGLNYDEAHDAVPAMQMVLGQSVNSLAVVHFAGRNWPLMIMPYIGATSTYLFVPGFIWIGVSVIAMRLAMVILGIVSLVLIWGFLRDFMDDRVAALSTFLLAINPTFIFWSRMGAYVSLPLLPLSIGALWSLYRWYRSGRARYLILAGLCLGLGLSTKILFIWLWVALGLGWLALSPWLAPRRGWRTWLWPLARAKSVVWVLGGLALVVGGGMILLYNLTNLETLRLLVRNSTRTELYGVNNLDVLHNLYTVFQVDFRTLLDGSWSDKIIGEQHTNILAVPAFLLAVGLICWLAWCRRLPYSTKRLAFLGILLISIVAQSAITITGLGAIHLLIVWPIPQVTLAVAILGMWDILRHHASIGNNGHFRVWSWGSVIAVVGVVSGAEILTTWHYHRDLTHLGGIGHYSDAINLLAQDLDRLGLARPVALDWGFKQNLELLTQGRVNPEEAFTYTQQPDKTYETYINWRMAQSAAIYLLHTPQYTAFQGHWEMFKQAAYCHRLEPELWRSYQQRNGQPVYLTYRLAPVPRLFQAPVISHPVDVRLGQGIGLLGYDLEKDHIQPGVDVALTLYWKALTAQDQNYKVFVHLLDENGKLWGQYDGPPVCWNYPTSNWFLGEIVPDRIHLASQAEIPAGRYRLFIGMYQQNSGQRLPVWHNGQSQAGDTLGLAEITVEK
ncbi:MAG: hypothetical protein EXR62_04495 [Chloroflexi bacterium]|nr:hypothetical protein [Chloroflexota bacterium]